ncbi:MAG TPA: methyltransferase domain-containing protein [Gemmatimonadaceae bacterium]|nr:methyltransferase domain-containing protein [Gemmatimonadaceae bacterium]
MADGILRRYRHDPDERPPARGAYEGTSKLETLLGSEVWTLIEGRRVLDFGCGGGQDSIELARRGAARVMGVDIVEQRRVEARERAAAAHVAERCIFCSQPDEPADVIISLDSFEHFADPAGILRIMHKWLAPGGQVLVSFGPTWYHPLGGHLFSVFPWAHLVLTEEALIRWRSSFKSDGATRFSEVEGGLNQMTIRRFRRLVEESPLRFARFETRPIRPLRLLHNRLTREFTTATVRCTLVAR